MDLTEILWIGAITDDDLWPSGLKWWLSFIAPWSSTVSLQTCIETDKHMSWTLHSQRITFQLPVIALRLDYSRLLKVIDFCSNWKRIYDFLLILTLAISRAFSFPRYSVEPTTRARVNLCVQSVALWRGVGLCVTVIVQSNLRHGNTNYFKGALSILKAICLCGHVCVIVLVAYYTTGIGQ